MREVRLTPTEMQIYEKMSSSEQTYIKRLMWMTSDCSSDETAEEYRDMMRAMFRGAYIHYIDPEAKDYE